MGGATDDAERREERFHAERGNEKPMLSGTIGVTGAPHPGPLPASGARELGRIASWRRRFVQMLKNSRQGGSDDIGCQGRC
jgi:hypothetical protein